MKISEALSLQDREVVSFIGGGGKTTLMYRLAEEIPLHHPVMITTTTKIFMPPADRHPLVLFGKGKAAGKELAGFLQSGIRPVIGSELLEDDKLKGIDPEAITLLKNMAEFVLVEADGSRGHSLKGHLAHEPVIPPATSVLVIVAGADVIGKPLLPQYVHRPEVVSERTGREMGSSINVEMIARLITHPEGMLRSTPAGARVVAFINKIDLADPGEAYRLGRLLLGEKIRKVVLSSATGADPVFDLI